jgi:hypothetical protein
MIRTEQLKFPRFFVCRIAPWPSMNCVLCMLAQVFCLVLLIFMFSILSLRTYTVGCLSRLNTLSCHGKSTS